MATIYDVDTNKLLEKTAEALKKTENVTMPDWATFVKTGQAKDRTPAKPDWWFMRAAALLRAIYIKGPIGTSKLRIKFGGKKDRGHKPEVFRKASGKIIRLMIQQLEKEGLVKYEEKGVHKGRIMTPKGKSFMDKQISMKNGPGGTEKKKAGAAPVAKPAAAGRKAAAAGAA